MLVWSTPASQYLDPDYCNETDHGCLIEMGKQEAIWVNAIAFLGCKYQLRTIVLEILIIYFRYLLCSIRRYF